MSGKYMKIKRIVIPTITLIIMTSQLLGCSSVTSKEMLDMLERQEAIVIEVPEPINQEQGEEVFTAWQNLASLTTYPEFRTTFDDALNITAFGDRGKNGCIYIDLDGNQTNNSTLYNAFMNQKFVKDYYENTDVSKKIIEASKGIYSDVESDKACLLAGYNGYFNIIPDSEPGYANINSTMTRLEAMTAIFKASTPVQDIKKNEKFAEAVDNKQYAIYAQNMADYSYLDYTNESLDSVTANGTITRAEFIYMLVQDYYSDEYGKVTGKESCYSDTKNGGDIASKVGFITKDKKTGEVTAPNRWQAYELSYALQNESNGMPETLYKAMVVAKNHNLITGDESRWSDGLTKGEALNLIITVYEDLASTNGYKTNVDRGAATGEAVTDATVVEDAGGSGDASNIFKDSITVNADGTWSYTEDLIGALMTYDFFNGCNEAEVKEYIESDGTIAKIVAYDPMKLDGYITSLAGGGDITLKGLQALEGKSNSSSTTASNSSSSTSNKNNQNNSSNQAGSTSNTTNETANTNEDNWTPPAKSSNNAEDGFAGVIDNGDGTLTSSDGTFTMSDGSNFGGDVSDPNNYTHYGNELH